MILNWGNDVVEFGKRKSDKANNWQKLDLDTYAIESPTVFCLSGNTATSTRDANGLCRFVEYSLDLLKSNKVNDIKDKVDIVGFKYAKHSSSSKIGDLTPEFVEEFNNKVLVPLFKDKNGQKLDLNSAMRNMSKISFFSYCVGAREVNDIMQNFNSKLEELGYSLTEISLINNAGKHVSFAPFDNVRNYLPTVRIISTQDEIIGQDVEGYLKDKEMEDFEGVLISKDNAGYIYGHKTQNAMCGGINIISSKLLNAFENAGNEHFINIIDRDEDWNLKPFQRDGDSLLSDNADCVSQMLSWSLSRAVDNSFENEKSNVYIPNNFETELYAELESIKDSFGKERLGISEEHKKNKRRSQYRNNSYKLLTRINRANLFKTFCEPKGDILTQLMKANNFEDIAFIFEKNNYYFLEEFLPKLDKLSKDEIYALRKASARCEKIRASKKWENNQVELLLHMSTAKTLEEIYELAECIDPQTLKESLLWVVDNNVVKVKEFTYEKALELMHSLKTQRKIEENEMKLPYYQLMIDKMQDIDIQGGDKFSRTIDLFERKNYFAIPDIIHECKYLDDKQKGVIRSIYNARQRACKFIRDNELANFDVLKSRVENASSIEEMMDLFAKNHYYGVEYILPEIVVLTDEEKQDILHKCKEHRQEIEHEK